MTITFVVVLCTAHLFSTVQSTVNHFEEFTDLKNKLLEGYDHEAIPLVHGSPVTVVVSIHLNDMVPMEKAASHFSVDGFFRFEWFDERLKYNNTYNISFFPFDHNFIKKIWKPNIYFPKSKAGYMHSIVQPNDLLLLFSDGRVLREQRLTVSSFCPMDLKFYPFDIQNCNLTMEPFSYNDQFIRLQWRSFEPLADSNKDLHISEFTSVQMEPKSTTTPYIDIGNYSRIYVTFILQRNLRLFILRDYIPCLLIVILSWVTFWISYRSAPARVALGITTVLTIVTKTNAVANKNAIGDVFRSIDWYMLISNLFVFSALGEYAVVQLLMNSKARVASVGSPTKKESVYTSFSLFEEKMVAEIPSKTKNVNDGKHKGTIEPNRRSCSKFDSLDVEVHVVDRISRVLFPVLFLLFNVIYFLVHEFHPSTLRMF